MSKETPETRKQKQRELNQANDEARKDLTMEKAGIEKQIKRVDLEMQKYARYANEVDGIKVEGLKERGPRAWFKNLMDRITRPKLEEGKEKVEEKGFKAVDPKAQELKAQNEKNLRAEVKYRQGTMDRFVKSYEDVSQEPEFDLKLFMHQASRELSPSEFAELGRVVNGERNTGGFKAMDQKAQELKDKNEQKSQSEMEK